MGIIDNIKGNIAERQRVQGLKYKLLQRLTIEQLQKLHSKYVGQEPGLQASPESLVGVIQGLKSGGKGRAQIIDAISKQVSWDSLKLWAKMEKVSLEEIE